MHNKRPARTAFCALCLFLAISLLLGGTGRVEAAPSICFVAINDRLPFDLYSSTMPFWEDGILYVPSDVFRDWGLSSFWTNYSQADWIYTINNSNHALAFHIADYYSDGDGDVYSKKSQIAIMQGPVVFLPVEFICQFFGLYFSYITDNTAYPIARITTGEQTYSDAKFATQAAPIIADQAAKYLNSTQSPPPSTSPSDPITSPDIPSGRTVALWIDTDGQALSGLLPALEERGFGATFFFDTAAMEALLPEIHDVCGGGFDLALSVKDNSDVQDALNAANDALDRDLHRRLRLCSLPEGSPTATIASYGYIPLDWDLDGDLYLTDGLKDALNTIDSDKTFVMRLTLTEQSLDSILLALDTLAQADISVTSVRETTP